MRKRPKVCEILSEKRTPILIEIELKTKKTCICYERLHVNHFRGSHDLPDVQLTFFDRTDAIFRRSW